MNYYEAQNLLMMFQKIDQGMSLRKLAFDLNEKQIPTKRGGMGWWHVLITRMLKDEAYIGKGYYGKAKR